MNDNIKISYLTGTKEFKPIQYCIISKFKSKWFFWEVKEYYVESEFCKIGPFNTYEEAAKFKSGCENA